MKPKTILARTPNAILLDGRLHPAHRPALRADDRGLTLGLGLFETVRVVRGQALLWGNHRQRLASGLERLGIPWPQAVDRSLARLAELARRNDLLEGEASLRITVSAGPPESAPVVLAELSPLSLRVRARREGAHLVVRGQPRAHADLKSLSWLASAEALRGLPPAVEPLIAVAGHALETASANLFVRCGDRIHTPPADGRILAGVARARVIELCAAQGLAVVEAPLKLEMLTVADEVWITNALLPIAPVVSLDGTPLTSGLLHRALRERYDLPTPANDGPR